MIILIGPSASGKTVAAKNLQEKIQIEKEKITFIKNKKE